MELLLVAHIIGDFYTQTDRIAIGKVKSFKYLSLHCLLYTIVMSAFFCMICDDIKSIIIFSALIFCSHFIIDRAKGRISLKTDKFSCFFFLMDQVLHLIVLYLLTLLEKSQFASFINNDMVINGFNMKRCLVCVFIALICCKPAAIFVSLLSKESL